MQHEEILIGRKYRIRLTDCETTVIVRGIAKDRKRTGRFYYYLTNWQTNERAVVRSASRFRAPAIENPLRNKY